MNLQVPLTFQPAYKTTVEDLCDPKFQKIQFIFELSNFVTLETVKKIQNNSAGNKMKF